MSSDQVAESRRDKALKLLQDRLEEKISLVSNGETQTREQLIIFNCCVIGLRNCAFSLRTSLHFTFVRRERKPFKIIFQGRNTIPPSSNCKNSQARQGSEGTHTLSSIPSLFGINRGGGRLLGSHTWTGAIRNKAMAPGQTTADSMATLQDPPS